MKEDGPALFLPKCMFTMTTNKSLIPYSNQSPRPIDPLDEWHQHLDLLSQTGELAITTIATYHRGIRLFGEWWANQRGNIVTSDTIRHWLSSLRDQYKSPSAINVRYAGVRHFFAWAHQRGYIEVNPTEDVKGAKRKGTKKRHLRDPLTDDEARRLLDAPNCATPQGARDYAILAIMLHTAVRTIELHRADLGDLRNKQDRLVLEVQRKGHEDKDEIILPASAVDALMNWLDLRGMSPGPLFISLSNRSEGQRLGLRSYREIVKGYMQSVGIDSPRKTTHSLRHTAISKAAENATPFEVQSMTGHESLDTILIYYRNQKRFDNPVEDRITYDDN